MAWRVVVMGVSGCGKSTVGRAMSERLGVDFVEGDALHPEPNVARMAAGVALTDADRHGWLQSVAEQLSNAAAAERGVVVSCSALKRSYRDLLRAAAPGLRLVYLHGRPDVLAARMGARTDHYMPASLLQSQLDTLQPPTPDEAALAYDIELPAPDIVAAVLRDLVAAETDVTMDTFTRIQLLTDADGRARFHTDTLALDQGKPQARLSALMPSAGMQLRRSPVGFRSDFHCTETPQWVFILGGRMEIFLQDGSSRVFGPGEHFHSADLLPPGAVFDPTLHGHWSRQVGPDPLVTLFVRSS